MFAITNKKPQPIAAVHSLPLRPVIHQFSGVSASDGAGVQLTRFIGHSKLDHLDPFLLLDAFRSDKADDYIAGFPPHPHRGFETVTYMIEGQMRHQDSTGHNGVIKSGGVQWMTAGKGIIHSEMPEQTAGLLWGYQLWLNLPAAEKMSAPRYQEYSANEIPIETRDGVTVKVIAGKTYFGTEGVISQPHTQPIYLDITLPREDSFIEPISDDYNVFIIILKGTIDIVSGNNASNPLSTDQLAILGEGEQIKLSGLEAENRCLVIAAKPLDEPIARSGPFVMNTQAELKKAFYDFQSGNF